MSLAKQPALFCAIALILGMIMSIYLNPPITALIIILLILSIILILCYRKKARSILLSVLILLSFILAGFARYEIKTTLAPDDHIQTIVSPAEPQVIRGTIVSEIIDKKENYKFEVEAKERLVDGKWDELNGKFIVYSPKYLGDLSYGDYVELNTKVRAPDASSNFNAFDYKAYLKQRSIHGIANIYDGENIKIIDHNRGGLAGKLIIPIRTKIRTIIYSTLSRPHAALLEGMLLGQGKNLPRRVRMYFANTGVIHILAVSGLHVGIIFLIFFGLFRYFLRIPYKYATLLTFAILLLYMGITNFRTSVTRATIMLIILMGATLVDRRSNLKNSLGVAALVILLWNPLRLTFIGFQLSFLAVAGIAFIYPKLNEMLGLKTSLKQSWSKRWGTRIIQLVLMSLSVVLMTAPVTAHHFYRFQLISPLANLLIIPVLLPILALGFITIFTSLISLWLAKVYAAANSVLLSYVLNITEWWSHANFAFLGVESSRIWLISIYYIALFATLYLDDIIWYLLANVSARWKKISLWALRPALGIIILIIMINPGYLEGLNQPDDILTATFFDVGEGDSILLQLPNDKNILIDTGQPGNYFFIQQPFLWSQGINTIDALILSHPQSDHIGDAINFIKDFKVKDIYDIGLAYPNDLYINLILKARQEGVEYHKVTKGDTIPNLGPQLSIRILHPDNNFVDKDGVYFGNMNNASSVVKVTYKEIAFLFTGDIQMLTELYLTQTLSDETLDADILKVPHHGSNTSSSPEFLATVDPKIGVITAGRSFNHPHEEVVERYEDAGIKLLGTNVDGAIEIQTDGHSINNIETKLSGNFNQLANLISKDWISCKN